MITIQEGAKLEVAIPGFAPVEGTVLETSQYCICIRYTDRHEPPRTWTHWFHLTGRRMGDKDDKPVKFIDRFMASVTV
jgi:hypothetical protein